MTPSRRVVVRAALSAGVLGAVVLVLFGVGPLRDARIRMHTLVVVDPPPVPVEVTAGRVRLTVTGALVKEVREDGAVLRAWAPTPSVRVADAGHGGPFTLRIDNVPARVRLTASGAVDETRDGIARIVRFAPAAVHRLELRSPDRDVAFAVLGDTGDNPTFDEALRLAVHEGMDFLVHVGDLIYDDEQMPAITGILARAPVPVYVARGNHDYRNARRIAYMRDLAPPYYAFHMSGATWVVLDNADDYLPWAWRHSTQYRWWRDGLGEARDGPLFVVMHKPPFDRRKPTKGAGMNDPAFAGQLVSDIARAGVDAVFTGHVHASHLWIEEGVPYVVSGEGYASPEGPETNHVALVRVRDGRVSIEQVRVWARATP